MRTIVLFLLLCSQFVCSQEIKTDWVAITVNGGVRGLINPRIVSNVVLYDKDSKPVFGDSALITFTQEMSDSLVLMKELPNGKKVQLNPSPDGSYGFGGSGDFEVTIIASTANGKLRYVEQPVTLANGPTPVDPDQPDETLSQVAKDARAATREYIQRMAADWKKLADESTKYPTVMAASQAMNSSDVLTRNIYKAAIGKIMEPQLGKGPLPTSAAKTFDDLSKGIGGVK